MKIEVTFLEDDARLIQSVFTYLQMNKVEEQQEQVKKLIFDWVYKWQYEMGRKSKDKAGKY
jgi:hypothetical protein